MKSQENSKYNKIIVPNFERIKELLIAGTPEYKIYGELNIGKDTWAKAKKEQDEFKEIIKEANMLQVEVVENMLLRKCKGYKVTDTKTYIEKDDTGKEKKRIEKFERNIPSSDSAIQFYLKNRKASKWKDRQEFKQDITQKIQNLVIDIEEEEEEEENN
jgi:hypothetical protein